MEKLSVFSIKDHIHSSYIIILTQEFEDYYDAEYAVKEMHDKKIDGGYRLIVEPSGKKKNKRR